MTDLAKRAGSTEHAMRCDPAYQRWREERRREEADDGEGYAVAAFRCAEDGSLAAAVGPRHAPDLRAATVDALDLVRGEYDVALIQGAGDEVVAWAADDGEGGIRGSGLLADPRSLRG